VVLILYASSCNAGRFLQSIQHVDSAGPAWQGKRKAFARQGMAGVGWFWKGIGHAFQAAKSKLYSAIGKKATTPQPFYHKFRRFFPLF
jgi:hypothetical protein